MLTEPLIHQPVLFDEILQLTDLQPGDQVIDCTLGLAGHSQAFLEKIGLTGKLLGLDWDIRSLEKAKEILADYSRQVRLVQASFADLSSVVGRENFLSRIDLIFFDLGWSSWQLLAKPGFSFQRPADNLDLRFDESKGETAADLLNTWSAQDLARIFQDYGQESHAVRLAQEIVLFRTEHPILKVYDLLAVIERIIPRRGKIHPATKVWQALRIAVNHELEILPKALESAWQLLIPGGKIAVITFHSLEDALVKQVFKKLPKDQAKWLNKNVIKPSWAEQVKNPRSRSAKLRVVQKIS